MTLFAVPLGPLSLAFVIAALVTALELITSKYPRTARFCVKSPWFYVYVLIYGLLGAGALDPMIAGPKGGPSSDMQRYED